MLHINGHCLKLAVFSKVPDCLNADSTTSLIEAVCTLNTCNGNPEKRFTDVALTKKTLNFYHAQKK